MDRVKNKIALITGAARGIGFATAKLLAKEGAFVILTDILDDIGQEAADNINKRYNNSAVYYNLDVSKEESWKNIFNIIEKKYNKLDILFNNAGITGLGMDLGSQDPENTSLESWDFVHKINLTSVFLGCKYAIKLMKQNSKNAQASIINMSSRSGVVGVPTIAAYASSKAAIRNHSKTVALYCASQGYNIRCNSIHPASIMTPIWDDMMPEDPIEKKKAIEKMAFSIPLGKMGDPDDVAYAVLYLASDESKFITGSELTIDGGILAGSAAAPKDSD